MGFGDSRQFYYTITTSYITIPKMPSPARGRFRSLMVPGHRHGGLFRKQRRPSEDFHLLMVPP